MCHHTARRPAPDDRPPRGREFLRCRDSGRGRCPVGDPAHPGAVRRRRVPATTLPGATLPGAIAPARRPPPSSSRPPAAPRPPRLPGPRRSPPCACRRRRAQPQPSRPRGPSSTPRRSSRSASWSPQLETSDWRRRDRVVPELVKLGDDAPPGPRGADPHHPDDRRPHRRPGRRTRSPATGDRPVLRHSAPEGRHPPRGVRRAGPPVVRRAQALPGQHVGERRGVAEGHDRRGPPAVLGRDGATWRARAGSSCGSGTAGCG